MLIKVNFQKLKKPKIENENKINDTNKKSIIRNMTFLVFTINTTVLVV